MKIDYSLITSILDTDLYKLTQMQIVWYDFNEAYVNYEFFNRNDTQFPEGFADELRNQINLMSENCQMRLDEYEYLKKLPYFRPEFLDFLATYRFAPDEVMINQVGGKLSILIGGPWYRVILWEVPLMALISELYFNLTGKKLCLDWSERIVEKAKKLSENNSDNAHKWIDMGTRRRYSLAVQDMVVCIMKNYKGFIGTSNPYLAMKYNVTPIGTMAHEFVMGISAKYGVEKANLMAMKHWNDFYQGKLAIFLPDTFTTDVALKSFDEYFANAFEGVRQDSGDPEDWADNKIIPHYQKLGIETKNKKLVFSDGLNPEKFIRLSNKYRDRFNVIGGIGTNLSNDVGHKPLNMVIKMVAANFGDGLINVVKLSDASTKYTGLTEVVNRVKKELKIS